RPLPLPCRVEELCSKVVYGRVTTGLNDSPWIEPGYNLTILCHHNNRFNSTHAHQTDRLPHLAFDVLKFGNHSSLIKPLYKLNSRRYPHRQELCAPRKSRDVVVK
ncbi:hypothetical protein, partial [Acidithiobacillus thiooxidans]|uniref:hypothetical protein n=1 Tax=Acidithiobacillus thiooxidans TaxID=930 RepID=UPI001F355125